MKRLNQLRKRVREIDRAIISLIGRRIEIAKKIGNEKSKRGIPLRNWEVEKAVLENATAAARELGLSSGLVKSIMQQLVIESRTQQELVHYSCYAGDKEDILIIGGLGEMGKWFSHFFANQGHNVSVYDIKGKSETFKLYKSLNQGIREASCVVISTPLKIVPRIIERVTELNFSGVVFDIASLKGYLTHSIAKAIEAGISITSIHAMFGPVTRTLSDKIICICDCGCKKANQKVEAFFRDTAVSKVRLSLEEHDRLISYVLGLSHIINIVFMNVLISSNYKYSELKKVASTTFFSQMKTTSSVIEENPYLYYEIQMFNPFKKNLYKRLKKAIRSTTDIVLSGNKRRFVEVMKEGRRWLTE